MRTPLQLLVSTKPFRVHDDSSEGLRIEPTTLRRFFVEDRLKYLDETRFPLSKATVHISEGGCQFAFNRVPEAPMQCLGCREFENNCQCERPRICFQDMQRIDFVTLDIERVGKPSKYSELSAIDDHRIREFEDYLKSNPNVAFFYRTKCWGLRIGVWSAHPLLNALDYRASAQQVIASLSPYAPGGEFSAIATSPCDAERRKVWEGGGWTRKLGKSCWA